jgi:hypothetical protein
MGTTALLLDPSCNRGIAHTVRERRALGLDGLLPNAVTTLDLEARHVRGLIEGLSPERVRIDLTNSSTTGRPRNGREAATP